MDWDALDLPRFSAGHRLCGVLGGPFASLT
jgi:hypothetical protein